MPTHETYVAGAKFRPAECQAALAALDQDTALTLEPDPGNAHDPNAVKVMHGSLHLGFVPRDLAADVLQLIAAGRIARVHKRTASSGIAIVFTEKE